MSQCSDAYNEPEARHQLLEEIKIMKTAGSHANLVTLIGCCTLPNNPICILLEYMKGGDLLAYLHDRRTIKSDDISSCSFEKAAVSKYANIVERNKNKNSYDKIEKQQFIKFALDIARGMEHLEAKEIIHRDLAARNILLTSDLTLKVTDVYIRIIKKWFTELHKFIMDLDFRFWLVTKWNIRNKQYSW